MNEKRKGATDTESNLIEATKYLKRATESAGKTGDQQLIEKVTKVGKEVETIRKDITQKLDKG